MSWLDSSASATKAIPSCCQRTNPVLKNIHRAVASMSGAFRDFLFPPLCASCETPLDSRGSVFCSACTGSIRTLSDNDELLRGTRLRLTSGGNVSGLISAFVLDEHGPLESAIHRLKYQHSPAVGVECGVRLGERIACQVDSAERWIVIPVPLHRVKLRERGYNQAQSICDGIVAIVPFEVLPHALVRNRYTRSQTTLRRDERQDNVHGAFSVNRRFLSEVRDTSILVVDDVITTGATINACAAALRASGARHVIACSIALAA